jgi:hypothetical protein
MSQSYTPPGSTRTYTIPDYGLADGPANFEAFCDTLDALLNDAGSSFHPFLFLGA